MKSTIQVKSTKEATTLVKLGAVAKQSSFSVIGAFYNKV